MGKTKRKTHQEFIEEMRVKHPTLEITGTYYNSKTRISYTCKKCDLHWEASANKLSLGRGCPRCAGNKLKTHEEYISQVNKINPNIKVMSRYISTSHNVSFECKICGYKWKTKPGNILRGKGCYWCGKKNMGLKLRKNSSDFKEEINKINPNITLLEEYIKEKVKILCFCKKCGNEWYASPRSLLINVGCPKCSFSKGEKQITLYFDRNNINYVSQYKFNDLIGLGGNKLSYDFYLPKYNVLIEYQGKQHKQPISFFGGEETFIRQKEHDRRKREYAIKHNIRLIEIWYYENIEEKIKESLNLETVTTAGCQ